MYLGFRLRSNTIVSWSQLRRFLLMSMCLLTYCVMNMCCLAYCIYSCLQKLKFIIILYIQENHGQSYKFMRVVTISIQSRWYQLRQFDEKIKFSRAFLIDSLRNYQAGQKRKFSKLKYNSKTTKLIQWSLWQSKCLRRGRPWLNREKGWGSSQFSL